MKDQVRWPQVILATVVTALAAWFTARWVGFISFAAAGLLLWLAAGYILRRISGLTGDSYGALCEMAEVVALIVFTAGVFL
jgi:adenosylcobinamide-GDP ribazoletransferase